jgi:competence protein ComEC
LLAPLIAGICFQHYICCDFPFIYPVIFLFALILFFSFTKVVVSYRFRWLWGALLFALLFASGCLLIQVQKKTDHLPYGQETLFTGIITANPQEREKTIKISCQVDGYQDTNNVWIGCKEDIILYFLNDSGILIPKAGDKLLFKTRINPIPAPQNPDEFDYRAYMARQSVFVSAFVKSNQIELIAQNQLPFYKTLPLSVQRFIFEEFKQAGITDNELAVVAALTIGDKQYLDSDLKQSFVSAGVIHLLAVSGLHVGIIFWALSFILSFLNRKRFGRVIKGLVILALLLLYAAVVGFSPSVTRATLMFSLYIIGQMCGRQRNTYNFIAASAFILCAFNPYCIFDAGFQLSYAAVLGIVYFQPKLYRILYVNNKLLDKIWNAACVTLAAQLAVTPVALYNFHQFPVYFLPANLVLVLYTTLIIYVAVVFLMVSWLPLLANAVAWLLANALLALNKSVMWIETLPGALIDGVYINTVQCIVLLLAILLMAFYWVYRNAYVLMVVLCLFIAVFAIRINHEVQIDNQQIYTVYNVNNSTFISFVEGKCGYCLRDSLHVTDYYNYQTRNNLVRQGFSSAKDLNAVIECNLLPFSYRNFIKFGEKTLYVVRESINTPDMACIYIGVDYMLVSQQSKQQPDKLLQYIRPKQIILDSSVPAWKARKWQLTANELNIPCHWVKDEGAFTYKIENSRLCVKTL